MEYNAPDPAATTGNLTVNIKERKGCVMITLLLLCVAIGVLAYFIGRNTQPEGYNSLIFNTAFIKDIAELATLETQGSASIRSTNITDDGSFSDALKKLFNERTVNISVPYIAKYGVNLGKQSVKIEKKDSVVTIILPQPQLLSYELKMDGLNIFSRTGILQSIDEQGFIRLEQKLYAQSRAQLEKNDTYKNIAKEKVQKVLDAYYAPMNLRVTLVFDDSKANKVVPDFN